ncbi:MAG: FecR domain-containing protein, partial [Spirochaetia bacterium]|nr:FecR domain-containing protein [Spirochaetia bacterium]
MNFKVISTVFVLSFTLFLASCQKAGPAAKVVKLTGSGEVLRGGKSESLALGKELMIGDVVRTGKASAAVLGFIQDSTLAEMQAETEFVVGAYSKNQKELRIAKGNVWLKVSKLGAGESFTLYSPAAVAGVRGTTFYTAQIGDMWVTCHCEGAVDFKNSGSAYHELHTKDHLAFTRGGKTVVLSPEELKS